MSIPPLHPAFLKVIEKSPWTDDETELLNACRAGDLEMAKGAMRRLQGSLNVDLCRIAFWHACGEGHVHVAQWLMTLNWDWRKRRVQSDFAHACVCGQLAIARMLLALGGVDIHADDDDAFRWACANVRAHHVARWLIRLDPGWDWWDAGLYSLKRWSGPRDVWMRSAVRSVNGQLLPCQCECLWPIKQQSNPNIHGDEDKAMATAVKNGDLDTARFLFQLDPRPGAWPVHCMTFMQAWSTNRDVWMRSVVGCAHASTSEAE